MSNSIPLQLNLQAPKKIVIPEPTPVPEGLGSLLVADLPPVEPVAVDHSIWADALAWVPDAGEIMAQIPEELDRDAAVKSFTRMWPANVHGAFIAAQAWGAGHRSSGCAAEAAQHASAILRGTDDTAGGGALDEAVISRLRTSVGTVRSAGAVAAYAYLMSPLGRVDGMDVTAVTTWLHVASAAGTRSDQAQAPILSTEIIEWLAREDIGIAVDPSRMKDYRRCITVFTEWGKPHGLSAVDVAQRVLCLLH